MTRRFSGKNASFWVASEHRSRTVWLVMVAALLLCGCKGRQLMPTPNLFADSETDPFAEVVPELQTNKVDVLYLTDRVPVERKDGTLRYGYERSQSLAFGSCIVEIGRDVSWEVLVENSRRRQRSVALPLTVQSITEHARLPATPFPFIQDGSSYKDDPATVARAAEIAEIFRRELQERLALTARKEAYIFIHGYNNTFEDAVFVIAELWHFMGRGGVPIAYTWPAGHPGLLRGYTYDRESSEFTIYHLKQLLRFLASCPELQKIHIIAHSRGTDVATSAVRELIIESRARGVDPKAEWRIDNILLAAPDLDMQVVSQRLGAERFFYGVKRLTIYVSQSDKAIGIASWLFASEHRIGRLRYEDLSPAQQAALASVRGISIVDARVRTSGIGHGYFHSNPAVSSDVILLLRDDREPGAVNGRPLFEHAPNYWELREGYPQATSD